MTQPADPSARHGGPYPTLAGRFALLTGVTGGIGRVLARDLAAAGATVTGLDLDADAVAAVDGVTHPLGADITGPATADAIATVARQQGRPFDLLVHCAAIPQEGQLLHELEPEQWRRHLDVNVTGTWLTTRAVVPAMIEHRRGSVVLVASTSALKPRVGSGAYSISKAAVLAMVRAMALELAPHGVSVNGVIPGATRTAKFAENWGAADPDAAFAALPNPAPSGVLVEPEQIAAAAMFLAAQPGASMTGSTMLLDGGYTI